MMRSRYKNLPVALLGCLAFLLCLTGSASAAFDRDSQNIASGDFFWMTNYVSENPPEPLELSRERLVCGWKTTSDVLEGPNEYSYVVCNPWSKFDPLGLDSHGEVADMAWNYGAALLNIANESAIYVDDMCGWTLHQITLHQIDSFERSALIADQKNGAILGKTVSDTQSLEKAMHRAASGDPLGAAGGFFDEVIGGDTPEEKAANLTAAALPFAKYIRVPKMPRLGQVKTTHGVSSAPSGSPTKTAQTIAKENAPTEAYNRRKHYGNTPTQADRRAVGAGKGQVADHDPPLVKRYYEGDPATGERPGHQMTNAERRASAKDRTRMKPQPQSESNQQGGRMSQYSKQKKKENNL